MQFRTSHGYFSAKPVEADLSQHQVINGIRYPDLVASGKTPGTPTHTINGVPVQIFGPHGQVQDWEDSVGWMSRTLVQKQSRRWVTSGVHWHRNSQSWQVRIQVNTLSVCGGYYQTLQEAENCANMLRGAHGLHMLFKPGNDVLPEVGTFDWCNENFILDEHGTLFRIRINGTLLRTNLMSKAPNVREIDALLHAADIRAVLQGKLERARVYGAVDPYGVRLGSRLSDMGLDKGDDARVFGELPEVIGHA